MKTDYMVVEFGESGEVNALHRDEFDLGFLGKQKIERASDIRFDEETQLWTIWLLGKYGPMSNELTEGFTTYNTARDVEVAWLERSALHDVAPLSKAGIELLSQTRTELGV